MDISPLSKAAFDVSYAESGSLCLTNPVYVVEQLSLLSDREQALPLHYRNRVLKPFVNFVLTKNLE